MGRWFKHGLFRRRNQIPKGYRVLKGARAFSESYKRKLERSRTILEKYGVPKKEIDLLMRDWPIVQAAHMAHTVNCNCSVNVAKHIFDLMLEKRKMWIDLWVDDSKSKGIGSLVAERQKATVTYDHLLKGVSDAIEKAEPPPDRKAGNWDAVDNLESRVRSIDHLLLPDGQRNSEIIWLPKMALLVTSEFVEHDLKRILGANYDAFFNENNGLAR